MRLPPLLHPGNPRAQRILAKAMSERAACFWATPCGRGCSIKANYQSTTVHLPPALASGNLDIISDAMAREVTHLEVLNQHVRLERERAGDAQQFGPGLEAPVGVPDREPRRLQRSQLPQCGAGREPHAAGGVGEGDRVVLAGAFHLNNERKRVALQGA